jgi:RNA polymerase primary sigma factor
MSLRHSHAPPEEIVSALRRYRALADEHGPESAEAVAVRNVIIERSVGLSFSVWKRHARHRIDHDDVLAVAVPGLIRAVERFEVGRGLCFSTYAVWWIRHALTRTAQNENSLVRVPVHVASSISRECTEAAAAARRMCSLDAPLGGESRETFGDATADPGALAAFTELEDEQERAALREALATLSEEQRQVLALRGEGVPFGEAALRLGIDRDRVRQLESQALGRLRQALHEAA